MINISMTDLLRIVESAVDAGVQEYVRGIDAALDGLRPSAARKYLRSRGVNPSVLELWEQAGLIKARRTSGLPNAARTYSFAKIKELLTAHHLNDACLASKDDYSA